MNAASLAQVERAFQRIIATHADAPATTTQLQLACDNDPNIVAEVRALLTHHAALSRAGETKAFLDPAELHGWRYVDSSSPSLLAEWDSSAVGQRVGDFTLIGELGSGGMGVVFVAEQFRPRRNVALKLIRRQVATPAMLRRFEHETELMGKLNHPGIAQVYAAGVAELRSAGSTIRCPYIAMELVSGESIREYVEARVIDHPDDRFARAQVALPLLVQLCEAMQHAHSRGVIHRDLKPANILVTEHNGEPEVKVLDFGIGRPARSGLLVDDGSLRTDPCGETDPNLTGHGKVIGTLNYMSPERLAGETAEATSDLYAIAAIGYQLITGRVPIDVCDCELAEARQRIATERPASLCTKHRLLALASSSQRNLLAIDVALQSALEKEPASRPASAAQLGQLLRRLIVR